MTVTDEPRRLPIIEVFPMRLGTESIIDVMVEIPEGDSDELPRPDALVTIELGDREMELTVWAVPSIPHPDGSRRMNIQFLKDDLGDCMPEEGMYLVIN